LSLTSPFSISEFLAVLALFSGFGPTIPSNILVEVFSCCLHLESSNLDQLAVSSHCSRFSWFRQAAWKHLN
jgi:hypothetical protein